MEKLQFTIEELNLIKTEFLEKTEYENNRFSKIFKPALAFVKKENGNQFIINSL